VIAWVDGRSTWKKVSASAVLMALVAPLLVGTGCGRDPARYAWERALLKADRALDNGQLDVAALEYERLRATAPLDSHRRYLQFRAASILERRGEFRAALDGYQALWNTGERDEYAARAVHRAGRVLLDAYGDRAGAMEVWEALVLSRPDRAVSDRALIDMLAVLDSNSDGDPGSSLRLLDRLYTGVGHTRMGDNLLYEMAARLRGMGDARLSELAYRRILERHGETGLADNARWHLAELLWARGDGHGALVQLRLLAEDRDSSWQVGIYESNLADDARFWRGVLKYRAGEFGGAQVEFGRLFVDFPQSVLRDDARYNVAVACGAGGDDGCVRRACADLQGAEPESRWVRACEQRAQGGELSLAGAVNFRASQGAGP
jgi:tetratricopeptide (TPR) repeat protein